MGEEMRGSSSLPFAEEEEGRGEEGVGEVVVGEVGVEEV